MIDHAFYEHERDTFSPVMTHTTSTTTAPHFVRAVGRNTIIQFIGKVIGTAIGFATSVLILRYLHPEGNGLYTTAMAYLGFFSVLADLGLYLVLIRDLNKPDADQDRIVGNLLALRWVSAGTILLIGAGLVWCFNFSWPEKIAVVIGTGSYIAIAATQLLVGVFQSKLAMVYVTIAELISRTALLAATWWVLRYHGSLYSIMAAVVVGSLVNFGFVWYYVRRFVHIRLRFDRAYWKSTILDTLPIAASIVLNLIYFRADTIILRLAHSAYDVGLYGAAYKILEILNTFPLMFVGLIIPALGATFARQDYDGFRRIFQKSFELLLTAVVPLLVGGWLLAEPMLVFIGRQEYAPAAPVLRLLLVAVGALYLGSLSGHVVTIINRQRQMVWSYLGVAVVGLVLYLALIPRFSLYGAAVGTIVTESLTAIVGYILVTRVMHLRLSIRVVPRLLLAGAVMAGTIFLIRPFNMWLAALGGILGYTAAIIVTRVIAPDVVRGLLSRSPEVTQAPLE